MKELKFYISRKVGFVLLIVLLGQLGVILSMFTGEFKTGIIQQKNEYKEIYENGDYYILGDNFYNEIEVRFLLKNNWFDILEQFNKKLHEAEVFKYLEMRPQPLSLQNYNGREENLYMYESGSSGLYKGVGKDSYSAVKSYWLGSEVFDHFKLKISEGRYFTNEEYVIDDIEYIAVILGDNYKGAYIIGDEFLIDDVIYTGIAKVVGFLEKGASVNNSSRLVSLDRYIILPMFYCDELPEHREEGRSYKFLYYEKNNGIIYSKISPNDIQDIIHIMCQDLDINGAYFVCGATNQQVATFGISINNISNFIKYFAIGTNLFSGVVFSLYIYMKIRSCGRYYAILLINGFTKADILWMILHEVLFILILVGGIGTLSGKILCKLIFPGVTVSILQGLPTILVCGVLAVATAIISFLKTDISVHLRSE